MGVGADTADCKFLERGGSLPLAALPDSFEFDDARELLLLGLLECERLETLPSHGDSDPERFCCCSCFCCCC